MHISDYEKVRELMALRETLHRQLQNVRNGLVTVRIDDYPVSERYRLSTCRHLETLVNEKIAHVHRELQEYGVIVTDLVTQP